MAIAKAEILDAIANMTVLELSQLIKEMEEKFGVSAAAATIAAAAPAAGAAAAPAEEQTEFTVMLTAVGESKVNVIKVVRAITESGSERKQKILWMARPNRSKKVFPRPMLKLYRNSSPRPAPLRKLSKQQATIRLAA